jgi:hypothetical protein
VLRWLKGKGAERGRPEELKDDHYELQLRKVKSTSEKQCEERAGFVERRLKRKLTMLI